MLNSNKRSVVLDLKTEDGRQALLDLVETADVLIENFAPGTMERLQLGPDAAARRTTRGWSWRRARATGPPAPTPTWRRWTSPCKRCPAASRPPASRRAPTKSGAAFVDFSGGIHLFGAISAALFQRERTGRGQIVEVSMHDTIYPMLASSLGGAAQPARPAAPRAHREPALGHGGGPVQHLRGERRMARDHLHLRAALARRGNRAGPAGVDRRPPVPHGEGPGRPHRRGRRRGVRRAPAPGRATSW